AVTFGVAASVSAGISTSSVISVFMEEDTSGFADCWWTGPSAIIPARPMKILLSNAVVAHGAFHHWMTRDMRALGHEVSLIDPDELCEQFGIELYRRVLLQRIAADKPDIFICYPPYDLLREQEHRLIRESGTVV